MPPLKISPQQYSIVTPSTPLLSPPPPPPLSPKAQLRKPPPLQHTKGVAVGKMKFTKKRLIPLLVCILSIASIIRLIKIANVTSSSALPLSLSQSQLHNRPPRSARNDQPTAASALTEKEMRFLADIVSNRAPCNLLVFGIEHQYLTLASSINAGGLTVFLEDEPEKLTSIKTISNSSVVYKLEYSTLASEAYELLKHAREHKGCSPIPSSGLFTASKCKLGLKKLAEEIYATKWDVVVVDGPCGQKPDCPGRMSSIYTASVLARNTSNVANVVVHDIDRTIEKWFSWEFLCDSNLVSSKGKFWNFRIPAAGAGAGAGAGAQTFFCPAT